jgi:hypothetical protein
MLASRLAQQSKLRCCGEFLDDLKLPGGRTCGDQSPPVRRQLGRGMVPMISMYTPDTPRRSSPARLRHLIATLCGNLR